MGRHIINVISSLGSSVVAPRESAHKRDSKTNSASLYVTYSEKWGLMHREGDGLLIDYWPKLSWAIPTSLLSYNS